MVINNAGGFHCLHFIIKDPIFGETYSIFLFQRILE